jgi:hypothetical protein
MAGLRELAEALNAPPDAGDAREEGTASLSKRNECERRHTEIDRELEALDVRWTELSAAEQRGAADRTLREQDEIEWLAALFLLSSFAWQRWWVWRLKIGLFFDLKSHRTTAAVTFETRMARAECVPCRANGMARRRQNSTRKPAIDCRSS